MSDATLPETSVVEAEFVLRDASYPFTAASEDAGCRLDLAEMVPRSGGRYAEFFHVTNADPDRIDALADAHGSVDATLVESYDGGALFEFLVSADCPARRLAELGGLPRRVSGVDGVGRFVVDILDRYDPPSVVGTFLEEYPEAELAAKREKDSVTPLFGEPSYRRVLDEALTDRQREVIAAAFEAGYYDWPRGCTGEEVAEQLGITSATFSEHVHAAERNLLATLLEGSPSDPSDAA